MPTSLLCMFWLTGCRAHPPTQATNVTLYSRCDQCSIDKWGDPILAEGPGDSADFAWFDKSFVEFNVACSSAGFPWTATPTLTEPPLYVVNPKPSDRAARRRCPRR